MSITSAGVPAGARPADAPRSVRATLPPHGSVLLASAGNAPTDATAVAARRAAERLGPCIQVVAALEPLAAPAIPFALPIIPPDVDAGRTDGMRVAIRHRLEPLLGTAPSG